MAGTIFGLPLSQQLDQETGEFLSGGLLYLYDANTTTPVTVYQDFNLSLAHQFPIELDAAGRIPEFWLADGSYRCVLRNADGVTQFDLAQTTALGPSSGTSSGTTVPSSALHQTGDFIWNPVSGARSGFVRANARTIGSASSGAAERASGDCENLFLFLWNNFTDTICPVTGGRGASAAADWASNKTIATPDMRGRAPFGLDDMGNAAAGILTGGTPTTAAASLGAEKTTLATGNLPSHTHGPGTLTVASHTHGTGTFAISSHTHGVGTLATSSSGLHNHSITIRDTGNNQSVTSGTATAADDTNASANTSTDGAHTHTITGATAATTPTISGASAGTSPAVSSGLTSATGSGTPATTVSPGRLGSWYIKL